MKTFKILLFILLLPSTGFAKKVVLTKKTSTLSQIDVKFTGSKKVLKLNSILSLDDYITDNKGYKLKEWTVTNVVVKAFVSNKPVYKKQKKKKKELDEDGNEILEDKGPSYAEQNLALMTDDKLVSTANSKVPGGFRSNIYMTLKNEYGISENSWKLKLKKGGPLFVRSLKITLQKN